MPNSSSRITPRAARRGTAGAATVAVTAGLAGLTGLMTAGTSHADEYNHDSMNGSRFALVRVGQVDDPMEDVLEHTLLLGGEHTWD